MKDVFKFLIVFQLLFLFIMKIQNLSLKRRNLEISSGLIVYIDSLCGDSRRFIQNHIKPFYLNLSLYSRTKVKIVPGSLMKRNSNNKFKCKHKNECFGNIVHLCAKSLFDYDKYNKFIICHFDYYKSFGKDIKKTTKFCSRKRYFSLIHCAKSKTGSSLAHQMINYKKKYKIKFTHSPQAIYKNKYHKKTERMVFSNLKYFLCKIIGSNIYNCLNSQ